MFNSVFRLCWCFPNSKEVLMDKPKCRVSPVLKMGTGTKSPGIVVRLEHFGQRAQYSPRKYYKKPYIYGMKTIYIPCLLLIFFLISLFGFEANAQHIRNYQIGCYYDTLGVKHTGLIDFGVGVAGFKTQDTYSKLNFKTDDSAKNQKVPIALIKSVIIQHVSGQDTILVLTEIDTTDFTKTQYFGQLCFSTPNTTIYTRQLIKYQSGGGGMMTMGTPGSNLSTPQGTVHIAGTPGTFNTGPYGGGENTETQYMYLVDQNATEPITRYNYKQVFSKLFADDLELVEKIKNKGYRYQDVEKIMIAYQAYQKGKK